jgi:hypothetical protein
MTDKHWKQVERRTARFFGCERTPLSGMNSGHNTHSDSLHPYLYVECKSTSKATQRKTFLHHLWDLWKDSKVKADLEHKAPVLALHLKHQEGFLLVINSTDMPTFVSEYLAARGLELDADDIPVNPED